MSDSMPQLLCEYLSRPFIFRGVHINRARAECICTMTERVWWTLCLRMVESDTHSDVAIQNEKRRRDTASPNSCAQNKNKYCYKNSYFIKDTEKPLWLWYLFCRRPQLFYITTDVVFLLSHNIGLRPKVSQLQKGVWKGSSKKLKKWIASGNISSYKSSGL